MKTARLWAFVAVMLAMVFSVASCSKDDKVELDRITGYWYWDTTYPYLIMDVFVSYTFYENGEYVKTVGGIDADPVETEGRYVISVTGSPRVLTLFAEDDQGREKAVEQYNIKRLDSKQMILESTSEEDNPRQKRLVRSEIVYN